MHFKSVKVFLLLVLCLGGLVPQTNAAGIEFSDVPKDKPYASAVYELAERGIIGGYEDGTFKPGSSITRGQAAAIIAKLLNLETENVNDPGFKDVSPRLWSFGAIAATAEKGIFRGYGDGRFGPNDKITRAQMASILIKAFDFHYYKRSLFTDIPFKDIDKLASHQEAVYTLYKIGITSGTSPTTFSPNDPITRAQAAVLITKTEKVRAGTVTLHAKDLEWYIFRGYDDYHNRYSAPEHNEEEEIVRVVPNSKTSRVLQIVPIKEGKQKLSLTGQKTEGSYEDVDHKKYYAHVTKENGRLKINFEETEDVLPTNVRLNVEKKPIKKVSLAAMDGNTIAEDSDFQTCGKYVNHNQICILLTEKGEYIAVVEYTDGTKVRYGVSASFVPSDFYYRTSSVEEKQAVTVDLSKAAGDFSEYKITNSNANPAEIKVTREGDSDIFHIEGLSGGFNTIKFPKNEGSKEHILGIDIWVQQIGSIIRVEANTYDYSDLLY